MADLLLHSLSEFRELIFALMGEARPRHIVEIGAESGRFTAALAAWAEPRGARVTTIDPAAAPAVRALAEAQPRVVQLVPEHSLAALGRIEAAELYLIDGDHNFYTVANELRIIHESVTRGAVQPVILVHDIGWPCARRDQYYDPESLPPEHLHPHRYDRGVHVDSPGTVEGGFSGAGRFAYADHEGGAQNGVLTAVEAFLARHADWELYTIPAIFGLGVLFPSAHPRRDPLVAHLCVYHENPLLARLEENRLRLFLEVRRLLDREASVAALHDALTAEKSRGVVRLAASFDAKVRAFVRALRAFPGRVRR
jgi:hypothetical protein